MSDLVERVRCGSMEALGALYERYAGMIYGVALRLTGEKAEAEDVLQDVFVALPRTLKTFEGSGSLEGWLKRVAVRTALMRIRARATSREVSVMEMESPDRRPDASVEGVALERALHRLPDSLRTVFVLKVIYGYPHDEIAQLLDITPTASRKRLSRARRALQRSLEE